MSADKKRVLIVDDSTDDIQVVMENLKDEFAVLVATSGKKGIELAEKNPKPDVILMDVMMAEMDGYEACRKLKENADTKNIDVIFVSASNSTKEKLAGYYAGGSDYLIKPVNPEELRQKVRLAIENKHIRDATVSDKDMAFKTAHTAMTSVSEQGTVLKYLRNSYSVSSVSDLAALIVNSLEEFGLNSSIQLRPYNDVVHHGSSAPLPPLEEELLKRLKDQGRIIEKGKRAIFNFGGISALIKNMPENDDERGRLRDHLAILFESSDSKLNSLNLHEQVTGLVRKSRDALRVIEVEQTSNKQISQSIMDSMLQKLETSFFSCGMTEGQEMVIINIVQGAINESQENFERGTSVDDRMHEILDELELSL